MKLPRWLSWLGRKLRAPAYIVWNVFRAAHGHDTHPFLRRKATSPWRRRMWRAGLILLLLVTSVLASPLVLVVGVVGGAVLVLGLGGLHVLGSLLDIWEG